MPGEVDGFGLAKWIEANRPEVAVIVTSGHAGAEETAHQLCEKHGEIMRSLIITAQSQPASETH